MAGRVEGALAAGPELEGLMTRLGRLSLQATDAARLSAVRELAMQQRALLDAARRGLDDAQRMLGQARAPDFGGYDALGKPQRWAPAGPRHDRRS